MIIKRELCAGARLHHDHLGTVLYDTVCQVLEKREGQPDTLYVCHDGEYKEVTLALLSYLTK